MKTIKKICFSNILFLFLLAVVFVGSANAADLYYSQAACESVCGKSNCEKTTTSVDTESITAYKCKSAPTSDNSYPNCTSAKANSGCSGKTGTAYTGCIESFIALYCKEGTSVSSLSSGNTGSNTSFPLDNGSAATTNNATQNNASFFPTGSSSHTPSTSSYANGGCDGDSTKSGGVCIPNNTGLPGSTVDQIIKNFLFWLLTIFATVATIAFIISGIQYLLASGSENMMETAKRNMIYSIIGILVGLSGLVILRAIEALLGANPTI